MKQKILTTVIALAAIAGAFLVGKNFAIAPQETPTPREQNISVSSPKAGATVSNPVTVKGKARVFENTFNYRLKDASSKVLYENHAMTSAPDAGIFGDFTVKIPVPTTATKNLLVEVFEYSAKDGTVINLVSVPVVLATQETMRIKAYFNSSTLDPQNTCTQVFPVERTVIKTQETAFISLTELLKGLTNTEKAAGYSTSIPAGVGINSVVISGGTARADFDSTLEMEVGGSCRVSAIRSQITETLKQFPTVKNVVVSIYGRTEDILQP